VPCDESFDDVLAAAKGGHEWALTVLYRDTHPALVRYLSVHAPGEEEDLASEVWIDVARSLRRFAGSRDGFRRFVSTIARRRAIDWGRQRGRRRTNPTASEVLSEIGGTADTEAVALARVAADEAVRRILELLPPRQAEVVLLRIVAGLTVAEVAEVIGRRPATVRVVQHRALRRLARLLGGPGDPAGNVQVQNHGLAAIRDRSQFVGALFTSGVARPSRGAA
jgi:RNA polymerase sigma-70 factor (ECF subfamily)